MTRTKGLKNLSKYKSFLIKSWPASLVLGPARSAKNTEARLVEMQAEVFTQNILAYQLFDREH